MMVQLLLLLLLEMLLESDRMMWLLLVVVLLLQWGWTRARARWNIWMMDMMNAVVCTVAD
jgi:hypothetical protein